VEVRELFYATPARRKFLKTDATELAHCIEAVRRHALVRPDVGFAIWHEGKLVEQWRAASGDGAHAQRLADVLGSEFVEQSVTVNYESSARRHDGQPAVRVWGVAGIPDAARSRADQQFAYVNGRYVRDKVLTHAARSAYEDVLHGHRQPVYALYVEIDPSRVDVNVHPTKIEVRFRDSREVHQAVRHATENALAIPRSTVAADAGLAGTAAVIAGASGNSEHHGFFAPGMGATSHEFRGGSNGGTGCPTLRPCGPRRRQARPVLRRQRLRAGLRLCTGSCARLARQWCAQPRRLHPPAPRRLAAGPRDCPAARHLCAG
jgi:DNA mismatch repair protein MutL